METAHKATTRSTECGRINLYQGTVNNLSGISHVLREECSKSTSSMNRSISETNDIMDTDFLM